MPLATPARLWWAKCGLSLAEVLVVLVISSLVLSVALPLASRSVADNLRVGARGLGAQNLSLQEDVFRRLLQSAVQPRAGVGEAPVSQTVTGDARRLALTVLAPSASACAQAARPTPLELRIVRRPWGGSLVCVAGEKTREMLRFSRPGAAFTYSADGSEWVNDWPDPFASGATSALQAPLVRLVAETQDGRLVWIERAGAGQPLSYDLRPLGEEYRDTRRNEVIIP